MFQWRPPATRVSVPLRHGPAVLCLPRLHKVQYCTCIVFFLALLEGVGSDLRDRTAARRRQPVELLLAMETSDARHFVD